MLGRMLRPIRVEPWTTLKLSMKDAAAGKWRQKELEVPAIIQQAYRSPAGKIGWLLINHTDHQVRCSARGPLPHWYLELTASEEIRRTTLDQSERVSAESLKNVTLQPAEVVLLEQL